MNEVVPVHSCHGSLQLLLWETVSYVELHRTGRVSPATDAALHRSDSGSQSTVNIIVNINMLLFNILLLKVLVESLTTWSDCFLIVFCKSMLVLLATSNDNSSSVMWIWSFFLMRVTSVFSLVSASTTRALSCSISMLVCLLEHNV